MLDAANDRPAPLAPSSSERPEAPPGNGANTQEQAGGVEHRRSIRLYRCDACPYETRDPGDGCCPCERSLGGVEIACTGTLVTVPLWCAGCQGEVGELAVVGDATGPLCHKCADERLARTQRIPTLTIRETAALWLAEQAVRP